MFMTLLHNLLSVAEEIGNVTEVTYYNNHIHVYVTTDKGERIKIYACAEGKENAEELE